ncbi:MAG: TrmB family transcriptional regulator [Candidatus Cloacimonetes bacterium]|nr:TrmB family transcriptional regulator [Candidatus Cloacimonadota bacterium]
MIQNKFIQDLQNIGLTFNQARGYFHLLQHSNLNAAELSARSGIPRTRVYDVIRELQVLGLAEEIRGEVTRFKAIPPRQGLGRIEEGWRTKFGLLDRLTESLDRLYASAGKRLDPTSYMEVLEDREKQVRRMNELDGMLKFELIAICKPPFDRSFEKFTEKETASIIRKGINYRFLIEMKDRKQTTLLRNLRRLEELGARIRFDAYLPVKMSVFDSRLVSFYRDEAGVAEKNSPLIIMSDLTLVKVFKTVFNLLFEKAGSLSA